MDPKAFFKLSYGLFVVGTEYQGRQNGCIINTAAQTTAEPGQMLATMLKTNLTTELILKKRSLTISVIGQDCPLETVRRFGMASGREKEKFEAACPKDSLGNPYVEEGMVARFSCRVKEALDLGTHYLFLCTVEDCLILDKAEPMTYADYRKRKAGQIPEAASKADSSRPAGSAPEAVSAGSRPASRWVCSICHYVYDGEIPFEELPADWKCPICKRGKEVFLKEE